MSEDKPTCATCVHWRLQNTEAGLCLRYPPQMVAGAMGVQQALPTTKPNHICGEHRAIVPVKVMIGQA